MSLSLLYQWDISNAPFTGWTGKIAPATGIFPGATGTNSYGATPDLSGQSNTVDESIYRTGCYWISSSGYDSITLTALTSGKDYVVRVHLYSPAPLVGGTMVVNVLNVNGGTNYGLSVPSVTGRVVDIPFTATGTTAVLNFGTTNAEKYFSALQVYKVVTPIDITGFTRPTTSINKGDDFSPTVNKTGGEGTFIYQWRKDNAAGTIITGATTANPTISQSYLPAGLNTLYAKISDDNGYDEDTTTVFVADITGAASTDNTTEDYDHNLSNVISGSIQVLSGGGSVAIVDSNTIRFTKPTTGSGTSVIKITDSTDSTKYGTKAINWTEDSTPPSDAVIGAATAIARHTNRIAWTPGADLQTGVVGAKIRRATNAGMTENVVEFLHTGSSPYDDTTAADGVEYWYEVKSKNGAGLFSTNWTAAANVTTWNAPPTITNSTQLSNAQRGQSYRETITTTGGNGARTLSAQPGHSLPAWLSFDTPTNPNDLIGTHNTLATNELVYLRLTDGNGQYSDYTLQVTTVDTIPPSNVSNVVATKNSETSVSITSDGATDLSNSLTYINQRSSDNFVSNIVTLGATTKDFTDSGLAPSVETTYRWRQKGKDPSNNVSTQYVVSNPITISPPPMPEFVTQSPLPYAKIGDPYEFQFAVQGGSGSGAFSVTVGNLPAEYMDENGLLSIEEVGDSNYVFNVLFEDANGTEVEETFTIPVSALAYISFQLKRDLEIEFVETISVFEKIEGDDDVAEDAPLKRRISASALYVGNIKREDLWAFLYAHRLRQRFLWHNPDRDEILEAKVIKFAGEKQALGAGVFEFVLEVGI